MIEILLATYNGAEYLKAQLDSVFAQEFKDFKVIARDDGSTDSTLDILEEYKLKYPEKFIYYKNDMPTGNAKDNFFLLMQDATADYICFCDQDDVWLSDKLSLTYQKMQTLDLSKPALVHTDLKVVNKDLNVLSDSFFKMQHFHTVDKTPLNRILAQNVITGCTVMINKPLLELAKNTNHKDIIMHDWWLGIIAAAFGNIAAIKQPTILYRQHEKNSVGANNLLKNISQFKTGKKDIYKSLVFTYNQAKIFISAFGNKLTEQQKKQISDFSYTLPNPSIPKILNNIRHGFLKQSFLRIVANFIFLFVEMIKCTGKRQ